MSSTGSDQQQQVHPLVSELLSHLSPKTPLIDEAPDSRVAAFYASRSVLITGATGFIGKALIDKLIRSCKDIKRIYVLIREKRGQSVHQRLAELIAAPYFDRIRSLNNGSNRTLEDKLWAIQGDITLPRLGISQEDTRLLSETCSCVFNSAATVRFTEPIEVAVQTNVYSVGQLVDLCDSLEKLEFLVHISTAYSNCHKRDTIEEIFYEPPIRGDQIQEAVKKLQQIQEQLNDIRPSQEDANNESLQKFYSDDEAPQVDLCDRFTDVALYRGNRPNTYTLTKGIAESYLLDCLKLRPERYLGGANKVQVAIIRPSIVVSTWREPSIGFVDNLQGIAGILSSFYTGILQAMPGTRDRLLDLVPVDMVANVTICAGWHLTNCRAEEDQQTSATTSADDHANRIKPHQGVYLFNMVSGYRNPVRLHQASDMIAVYAYKFPTKYLFRLPSSYFFPAGKMYNLYNLVNQIFPAHVIDFVRSRLLRQRVDRRASAVAIYSRINKLAKILIPFTTNQWTWCDSNVAALYSRLDETDKQLFPFDVTQIDWSDYLRTYTLGLRVYALKDPASSVPEALRSLRRRQYANWTTITTLVMVFYYFLLSGSRL